MSHPAKEMEVEEPSLAVRLGQAFRRYFIAGLATLFPVAVTMSLVWGIFNVADRWLGHWLPVKIPGLGLVLTVLIILAVGVFVVHFFGRVAFHTIEVWFERLPFINKIFPAVKQLARFLFDEEARHGAFRRVVLVQYPRPGAYSVAFITNESETTATGKRERLLTLLIPNPPSPFTGPIIFVPEPDVIPLEMSVEEAVKLIVSGGVVASPLQPVNRDER